MKKTWYNRLLLSYVPMLFITISMLVFVSVSIISEITVHETEKANRIFTEYVADSMQTSLQSVERLVLESVISSGAFSTSAFTEFFDPSGTTNPQLVNFQVSKQLGNLINDNPMIHSIYLYRAADNVVLTNSLIEGLDQFADKDFVKQALAHPQKTTWSPVRPYWEFSIDPKDNVISMTKRALLPFGNQGIIVVNVKVDALLRFADQMINHDISFLDIHSADGQQVYPLPGGTAASGNHAKTGKVITRIHSDYIGWDFESGINGGLLFSWVSVISKIWIGIGIVTVAASLFFFIFVTRRNYKPIESIVQQINDYSKTQLKGGGSDEFSYIQKVLDNLFREKDTYEQQRKEDLPLKRRQAFLELVEGQGAADERAWQARLAKLGVPGDYGRPTAAVLEIDRYDDFKRTYPAQDQSLLKFALTNVAEEFFGKTIWPEWIAGSRLAILFAEKGDDFADRLDKLRIWVALNLKFSITVGVGREGAGLPAAASSFEGALAALQYKMSLGSNQIISIEELDSGLARDTRVYFQLFDAMLQDLRMGNRAFLDQLASCAQRLEQDVLLCEEIDHLLQLWLGMVQRSMEEAEPELAELWQTALHPELAALLERAETLEELLPPFVAAFERLYAKQLALQEAKSYHHMMKDIRAYIEQHYANPDLSLSHISDKFAVSGKYSSQLFKEHFGMKFVDFLVNLRMEHAKRLLLETDEPIQDIAVKVGYLHAISFGRTFKKVVGVTPGDYRKFGLS